MASNKDGIRLKENILQGSFIVDEGFKIFSRTRKELKLITDRTN